jgi:surface protein
MNADYLNEFEQMNETTESVFDLGEHELLIVLNDGTNLTSWEDVDDFNDVLYISEDFSGQKTFSRCGSCNNVKVIVVQGYVVSSQLERVSTLFNDNFDMHFSHLESLIAFYALNCDMSRKINMKNMFKSCFSLEYVYLEDWDTSNTENFWGMFINCYNLKTLEGLENWDLDSARTMESMFESCISLEDVSFLSDWDMSNVENIFDMFRDCYSLNDVSCLNWRFNNLKKGDNLFINCNKLEKFPDWYDEEFINQFGIRKDLENMSDESIFNKIINGEFDEYDQFVAISYIEDENLLRSLLNNSSTHFYGIRAVLLNPNLKDNGILEEYALDSDDYVERAYAIENPNFKNIRLLKRIVKQDRHCLVRVKAGRKLKELKEKIGNKDFAQEFKESFENQCFEKLYEIMSEWRQYYPDDANSGLAMVIFDFLNENIEFIKTFELYLQVIRDEPLNSSLFDWFNSTAINLMEKRVDEDIGFSEMFNNKYKSDSLLNNFSNDFLSLFEFTVGNNHAENLTVLKILVNLWEEDCPKDANMHCAYVVLNIKNMSDDELDGRVKKANELTPGDKNSYPNLLTLMNAVCRANNI